MVRYGQITQVYRFGGADAFEPLEGMRYPVDLERYKVDDVAFGAVVRFDLFGETPHAVVDAVIPLDETPSEVRTALSDIPEAWPSVISG
jgi:hypothetical protein